MHSLHRSRIEVLRGRQERQHSDYIARKARELNQLEGEHEEEMSLVDEEAKVEMEGLERAFEVKRGRLEGRWRVEVRVEIEKGTRRVEGGKVEVPPDIVLGGMEARAGGVGVEEGEAAGAEVDVRTGDS